GIRASAEEFRETPAAPPPAPLAFPVCRPPSTSFPWSSSATTRPWPPSSWRSPSASRSRSTGAAAPPRATAPTCPRQEYRGDAVACFADAAGRDVFAAVVEVQRSPDERKRFSWPVYHSTVRARLECDTVLMVLCFDRATAAWARAPILTGHPEYVLSPLRSEEHTSELQSRENLVCRLLLEK